MKRTAATGAAAGTSRLAFGLSLPREDAKLPDAGLYARRGLADGSARQVKRIRDHNVWRRTLRLRECLGGV